MTFFQKIQDWISPRRWLTFFLTISAVEGAATVVYLLSIPADPKNSIFLGYSARRLGVMGAVVLGSLVFAGLAYLFERKADWRERLNALLNRPTKVSSTILAGLVVTFLVGWALLWSPPYRFIPYDLYFKGLLPVIVWVTVISAQASLLIANIQYGIDFRRLRKTLQEQVPVVRASIMAMAGIVLVWVVILLTRWGIEPDVVYWNNPGVPLLGLQVLVAWAAGLGTLMAGTWLAGRLSKKWSLGFDIFLFISIWVVAAVLWTGEPQVRSFFAPQPAPPNHAFYPISDAMTYDLAAQFALIGQGLENGRHTDKPLLSAFLVLVHLIAGQDYDRVANVQAIFLALLPAFLYALGRALHSRPAGVLAGLLAAFKGKNAIASAWMVLSANPKELTSELPMTVLLAVLTLLIVLWLQRPERRFALGMLAAGVIGLGTLVRHNAWVFVPFFALLGLYVLWRGKHRVFLGAALFVIAFAASITPWMIRTNPVTGSPFYFMGPLEGVVWEDRYVDFEVDGAQDAGGSQSGEIPVEEIISPSEAASIQDGETPPETTATLPAQAIPPAQGEETLPEPGVTQSEQSAAPVQGGETSPEPIAAQPVQVTAPPEPLTPESRLVEALQFIPRHFFHNWITSVLVLPLSPVNDDLRTTIMTAGSVWGAEWVSALSPLEFILLIFNLLGAAVGVGVSWSRWRLAGAAPLFTFIIYHLGTAVARTSGGRYIVPVDWVVYFYFAVGIVQLSLWGLALFGRSSEPEVEERQPVESGDLLAGWGGKLAALGLLVLVGVTPLMADKLIPRQYKATTAQEVVDILAARGLIDNLGVDQAELETFLEGEAAVALVGRGLYPRFYNYDGGVSAKGAYAPLPYQRLIFTLITPQGSEYDILPRLSYIEHFPNGSDVIVIGCRNSEANVLSLVVLGEVDLVYLRTPEIPMECPSRAPLCDGNGNCL
jgi:hypothetical protein